MKKTILFVLIICAMTMLCTGNVLYAGGEAPSDWPPAYAPADTPAYRLLAPAAFYPAQASSCFDGQLNTFPDFADGTAGLTAEFETAAAVYLLRYHPRENWPDRVDGIVVEGALTRTGSYDVLWQATTAHPSVQWYEVALENPRQYKFIRVKNAVWGNIAELEFYTRDAAFPEAYQVPLSLSNGIYDMGENYPEKITAVAPLVSNPAQYQGQTVYAANRHEGPWTELLTFDVLTDNKAPVSDNGVYRYLRCAVAIECYAQRYAAGDYPSIADAVIPQSPAIGGRVSPRYQLIGAGNGAENTEKTVFWWYSSADGRAWSLIPGAAAREYTVRPEDEGKVLRCRIMPVSTEAPYGGLAFYTAPSAAVAKTLPPKATNVYIIGAVVPGETITGSYEFYDPNGLAEDGTAFAWYYSDTADAVFPAGWSLIPGASSKSYVVTEDDAARFLKFVVVPRVNGASVEGKQSVGAPADSLPAATPTAPEAKNVAVQTPAGVSNIQVGDKAVIRYEYYDINLDAESGTTCSWERDAAGNSPWLAIADAGGKEYTISPADVNSFIRAGVTVRNHGEKGEDARPVYVVFAAPFAPAASDVTVSGSAAVGKTLTGSYRYHDENENPDYGSRHEWIRSDATVVGTGLSYLVKSADAGYTLRLVVTPRTNFAPEEGLPVSSAVINIPSEKSSGASGGSGVARVITPEQTQSYVPALSEPEKDASAEAGSAFADIGSHWARQDIAYLIERQIVFGRNGGFEPEAAVTRAEFSALLVRAMGLDIAALPQSPFRDVGAGHWGAGVIQAAFDAKLVTGSDGSFYPDANITREEMTKMIMNACERRLKTKEPPKADISLLTDGAQISEWAADSIAGAIGLGVITGMDDGSFAPKSNATRAQAAVVIKRFLIICEEEGKQ